MQFARLFAATGLLTIAGACNAILGNESDYVLVGAGGESEAEAGSTGVTTGGAAGASTSGGGKGGRAGAAGKGGSAAAGRGGTGGNAGAGEAGADATSGASGEAGAASCVKRGAENCFNGIDDDCNGAIDCADSACVGPAECRPRPSGTELGYFSSPGKDCPTGYTALDLREGLTVPMECNGCSCINPTDLLCDSGIYGHGSYACPSYQFNGQLWDMFNDRCGQLPGDPNIHYYSIRGTSQCTPSGTPTLDAVSWNQSATFCLAERVGAGCGSGKACVPADESGWCTLGSGACSADYADDRDTWYEGVDDQRACTDCSCGLGTADCSATYIGVYADGGCGGTPTALPAVSDQGDACSLPFGPQSGRIIGNPVPGSGSCQPNVFVTGDATPTNGHHVCCAP